jgi:hypothetical protein
VKVVTLHNRIRQRFDSEPGILTARLQEEKRVKREKRKMTVEEEEGVEATTCTRVKEHEQHIITWHKFRCR